MKFNEIPAIRKGTPKISAEHGFSLIELVFIIILIGILSAVSVVMYGDLLDRTKTAVCRTNQYMLESAQTLYFADQVAKNIETPHYAADLTELASFMSGNLIPACPLGFHYEIQPEGKISCQDPDHNRRP